MSPTTASRTSARAAWWAIPLIRLGVGAVFLSEGLQKFLFPTLRGPGRFAELGFAAPTLWGYAVGGVEVLCGALLLLGLYTRLAAIPLTLIMLGAIVTTKLPLLVNTATAGLPGFWEMAHAMRTDYAMLLSSLFLIVAGAGPWSLDHLRQRRS